jgi:hypothetical protein
MVPMDGSGPSQRMESRQSTGTAVATRRLAVTVLWSTTARSLFVSDAAPWSTLLDCEWEIRTHLIERCLKHKRQLSSRYCECNKATRSSRSGSLMSEETFPNGRGVPGPITVRQFRRIHPGTTARSSNKQRLIPWFWTQISDLNTKTVRTVQNHWKFQR